MKTWKKIVIVSVVIPIIAFVIFWVIVYNIGYV